MTDVRASLLKWLELRGGSFEDFAFPSRTDHAAHISTRQYARLVDEWVTGIGLPGEDYGTHSLRRTKASIIYKATGNLRAVQILLGHTKIESTVRYLGVDVEAKPEDSLEVVTEGYLHTKFLQVAPRPRPLTARPFTDAPPLCPLFLQLEEGLATDAKTVRKAPIRRLPSPSLAFSHP